MYELKALQDFFFDGQPDPDGRIERYLRQPAQIELDKSEKEPIVKVIDGTEIIFRPGERVHCTLREVYDIGGDPRCYGQVREDQHAIKRGWWGAYEIPPVADDIRRIKELQDIGMTEEADRYMPKNREIPIFHFYYDSGEEMHEAFPLYEASYAPPEAPTLADELATLRENQRRLEAQIKGNMASLADEV